MEEQKWWEDAIIYQVYPMSFNDTNNDGIGNINGITEKLDYIKSLGANTIWLNPVTLSNHEDNGYDVVDYKKIDPMFGTEEDKDRFIKEAKEKGFRLIFDFPLNHTSDQHPWFKNALKGKDNPYRHYYIWADSNGDPYPNNWTAGFGGSAWTKELNGDQYYLHLFMEQMPDLNWDHEPLREEMADVLNYWSDRGIDGARLDAFIYLDVDKEFPNHLEDTGEGQEVISYGEKLKEYLSELNERTNKHEKDFLMLGEATSADAEKVSWYTRDNMVDKVITLRHFTDKDEEKIDDLPEDKQHVPLDLKKFKQMQKEFQEIVSEKGGPVLFWDNHDRPRSHQKYGDMENYRDNTAKMMATLLYLQRGVPIIYNGEEIGMKNAWFEDPENISDAGAMDFYDAARDYGWSHKETMKHLNLTARDASRGIMQWNSNNKGVGFTEDAAPWMIAAQEKKYNVSDQEEDKDSILNYYRELIKWKKTDLFKKGDWSMKESEDTIYAYERQYENQKGLVYCNFSSEDKEVEVKDYQELGEMVLSTDDVKFNDTTIELPPYGACVFVKK